MTGDRLPAVRDAGPAADAYPRPMQLYFACPACRLVARPSSAYFPATGFPDDSGAWTGGSAEVRCAKCGHRHEVHGTDIVPASSTATCPRCTHRSPCPPSAATATCDGCGLVHDGPAATTDPVLRERVRATEGLHAVRTRGTLQAAKDRAARRAGLPVGEEVVEVLPAADAQPGVVPLDPELLPPASLPSVNGDTTVPDAEVLPAEEGEGSVAAESRETGGRRSGPPAAVQVPDAPAPATGCSAKTGSGYARDWQLWLEYHQSAAAEHGHRGPDAVTPEAFAGFVGWLDQVYAAAPATAARRITGVTAEARRRGLDVPAEATLAARGALRLLKRTKAKARNPERLRAIVTADPVVAEPPASRRKRGVYELPLLAQLRDAALHGIRLSVGCGMAALAALDDTDLVVVEGGLKIAVPAAGASPARSEVVAYGDDPEVCPVRLWLRWEQAKLDAGAAARGPAWLAVDQWGHLGGRLGQDAVGRALARSSQRAGLGP